MAIERLLYMIYPELKNFSLKHRLLWLKCKVIVEAGSLLPTPNMPQIFPLLFIIFSLSVFLPFDPFLADAGFILS